MQVNIRQPNIEVVASAPAAGVLPVITMDSGRRGTCYGVFLTYNASATVASREFVLVLADDSAAVAMVLPHGRTITASELVFVQYTAFGGATPNDSTIGATLVTSVGLGAPIPLEPGWNLQITQVNFQANDTLSMVALIAFDVT